MQQLYNDYSGFIKNKFGCRVQKISVNTGLTCPNRDGSKGTGGCIYCNNESFNPAYALGSKTITQQLDEGINYFSKKYPSQKYIAYFQSFSNTYESADSIKKRIEEALSFRNIVGISIATRPDCINDEILEMLASFSKKYFFVIEYGIESSINRTLEQINRCHSWEDSVNAIRKTSYYGIYSCAHLIIGLPGEAEEDYISHAKEISKLPVNFIKLHQLQILKGTKAEEMYISKPELFLIPSLEEYTDIICEFISNLSPDIIIERFTGESPPEMVVAPKWNRIKNFEVTEIIRKKLKERGIYQGKSYNIK